MVDDSSLTFTPLEVGLRGLPAVPRSPQTDKFTTNPLMDFALLQSFTRAGPSFVAEPPRMNPAVRYSGHTLLRFLAPTAHEVTGSDLRRACLARLCSASRLSQPPDALLPPKPCRFCFAPVALMGFALQRFSLPNCRDASRPPLPLLTFLSTVAPRRVVQARSVPASPRDVLSCSEKRI